MTELTGDCDVGHFLVGEFLEVERSTRDRGCSVVRATFYTQSRGNTVTHGTLARTHRHSSVLHSLLLFCSPSVLAEVHRHVE